MKSARSLAVVACLLSVSVMVNAKPADVVARVGADSITLDQVNDRIASFPAQYQSALQTKEARTRLLDQMIDEQILVLAARKEGVQSSLDYKRQMAASERQLLLGLYLRNKIDQKISVSDEEVKQFYDQNPDRFKEAELRNASHILVKTENEAKEIISQLNAGGDFAKLAQEKSLDKASGANGGELGLFGKGQMVSEFEQSAFSLKKGEISAPIKTQFGYHIIKLNDIQVRPKVDFTPEVAQQLKSALFQQKRDQAVSELLEKLKKTSKVSKSLNKL